MTRGEARSIVLELPGVSEHPTMGTLGFKAGGKVLCRIGARTSPDDLIFKSVRFDEAEHLIERYPQTFHTTPHYVRADCVLARLQTLDPGLMRTMLERRWRQLAKKSDVKAWDSR